MKVITCIKCGAQKKVQNGNVGKYCSRQCQRADVKRTTYECAGCGTSVTVPTSQHGNRSYCSKDCRSQHKQRERTHVCEVCGDDFLASGRGKAGRLQRFCSNACRVIGAPGGLQDGRSRHPHYNRWENMVSRCTRPQHQMWPQYGGRGIFVCDEWMDPFVFYRYLDEVLGPIPPGASLDRIDNDKGYEPGNIRWATAIEQFRNRRPFTVDPARNKKKGLVYVETQPRGLSQTGTHSWVIR